MSTSPELLRGTDATGAAAARLDSDLLTSRWAASSPLSRYGVDPRLVDRRLEPAFAELVASAESTARAEGFAAGLAEGRAAAAMELAAQRTQLEAEHDRGILEGRRLLGRALDALDAAVGEWESRTAPAAQQLEHAAADLACAIVGELAGHLPELAEHAVQRTLALAVDAPGDIVLRLHPADADRISPAAAGRAVHVVADPAIQPGGCFAEVGGRRIDARLDSTLARLRAALVEEHL